ncbi:MAG: YggT family protein, partial [Pseudomonadota bacterium]
MIAIFETLFLVMDIFTWIIIASVIFSWLYAFNVINSSNQFVNQIGGFLHQITE